MTNPVFTKFYPLLGSTRVAQSRTYLHAATAGPVMRGTGAFTLSTSSGVLVQTFDVTDTQRVFIGPGTTGYPAGTYLLYAFLDQPLAPDTTYVVTYPAGIVVNATGNPSVATQNIFATGVTITAPTVLSAASFYPARDTNNLQTLTTSTITFNKAVTLGTGNVLVKDGNGAVVETIAIAAPAVTVSGSQLTVKFSFTPSPGVKYSIELPAGAVKDSTNALSPAITDYFVTTLLSALQRTSTIPADKAGDVVKNTRVIISFNRPIKAGTGAITLSGTGGVEPITFDIADSAVSVISGNTVTLTPPTGLLRSTTYTVTYPAGIVNDMVGNEAAGSSFTFATDSSNPQLRTFSPANGSTNAMQGVDKRVTAYCYDNGPSIRYGAGVITLRDVNGGVVESFDAADHTKVVLSPAFNASGVLAGYYFLTIVPTALLPNTTYIVDYPAGIVTDLAGNPSDAATNRFTTFVDSVAPTVTSFSPSNGAASVPVSTTQCVITFSELIKLGTGTILIKNAAGNTVASYVVGVDAGATAASYQLTLKLGAYVSGGLVSGERYTVVLPAGCVSDLAGNPYSGSSTYSFAIFKDITPPRVTSVSPANKTATTYANMLTGISINFSEAVKPATGQVLLKKGVAGSEALVKSFDVSTDVIFSGVNVRLPVTGLLVNCTRYTIEFPAGAVTDLSGNPLATTLLSEFNTVCPVKEPLLATNFSPANGSTGIVFPASASSSTGTPSGIIIDFNRAISRGAGVIKIMDGVNIVASYDVAVDTGVLIMGKQIGLVLSTSTLIAGHKYTAVFPAGSFVDADGVAWAGISGYGFTMLGEKVPPKLVSVVPINDSTVTSANNITLTFDEPVTSGGGQIYLNGGTEVFSLSSGNMIFSGNTLVLTPKKPFSVGLNTLTFSADAVYDLPGNKWSPLTGYHFTIGDTISPYSILYYPLKGATGVQLSSNIFVKFSETVKRGTGNITLTPAGGTPIIYTPNSTNVTVNGNMMVITPTDQLLNNTVYALSYDAGCVTDVYGNKWLGDTATTWFNTADTLVLKSTSYVPDRDSKTVPPSTTELKIFFNKPIVTGTGGFALYNATGTLVDTSAATLRIGPSFIVVYPITLASASKYTATFKAGFVNDASTGAPWVGDLTYSFTTSDTSPLRVLSYDPLNSATDVVVDKTITVKFNKPVVTNSGSIKLYDQLTNELVWTYPIPSLSALLSGDTLTVKYPAPQTYLSNKTYKIVLDSGSVKDASGNLLEYSESLFTTLDMTPLFLIRTAPPVDATNVGLNTDVSLTFNKPVKLSNTQGSATLTAANSLTRPSLTVSGAIVRPVGVVGSLIGSTKYNLAVPTGLITDMAGKPWSGISNFNFTTADTVAPTLLTITPTNNASSVSVSANIVLKFSEAVKIGSGTITLTAAGGASLSYTVPCSEVTVTGDTVVINPSSDLTPGATYTCNFPNGCVADLSGNAWAGLSNTAFTTVGPALMLTGSSPTNGATDITLAGIGCGLGFNQPIRIPGGTVTVPFTSPGNPTLQYTFTVNLGNPNVARADSMSGTHVAGATYTANFPAGMVTDMAGNAWAGLNGFHYTVVGNAPLAYDQQRIGPIQLNPNGSAAITSSIRFAFNKPVTAVAGGVLELRTRNTNGSAGPIVESYTLPSSRVSVLGTDVIIDPIADFTVGQGYNMWFPIGAFRSATGELSGSMNLTFSA